MQGKLGTLPNAASKDTQTSDDQQPVAIMGFGGVVTVSQSRNQAVNVNRDRFLRGLGAQ